MKAKQKGGIRRISHKEAVDIVKRYLNEKCNAFIDLSAKKPQGKIALPDVIAYSKDNKRHWFCEVETSQAKLEQAVQKLNEAFQVYRNEINQAAFLVAVTRDLFVELSNTGKWQSFYDKMKNEKKGILVVYVTKVEIKLAARVFDNRLFPIWL